ncbi:MAG: DUF4013 domain-containing protein [Pirellulaceae bacterium]
MNRYWNPNREKVPKPKRNLAVTGGEISVSTLPMCESSFSDNDSIGSQGSASDEISEAEFVAWGHSEYQFQSWPLRTIQFLGTSLNALIGFVAMSVLIALVANIPILQLASFGFLLDVSGRIGQSGRLRDGFTGVQVAARIGRGILGTALCLIPVLLIEQFWYAAYLVDATSAQTTSWRVALSIVSAITFFHVLAAWFCGGQFKHFIWPLIVPFSLGLWLFRKALATSWGNRAVGVLSKPVSKHLASDLQHVPPLRDWFLPFIIVHRFRQRRLWNEARDRLWDFSQSIPFRKVFALGLKGFVGSFVWLFIPTMFMIVGTSRQTPGAVLISLIGTVLTTTVFCLLLILQSEFAVTGRLRTFFDLRTFWSRIRSAPVWFVIAALITFVLALPLFLLKIEEIPDELKWSLSLVFVMTGWMSRVAMGWANGRARKAIGPRRWWWGIPVATLMLPLSLSFVVILFFTRYVSWHGVWSLIENPIFLLPAPFWL